MIVNCREREKKNIFTIYVTVIFVKSGLSFPFQITANLTSILMEMPLLECTVDDMCKTVKKIF